MPTWLRRAALSAERLFLRADRKLEPYKRAIRLLLVTAGLLASILASSVWDFFVKNYGAAHWLAPVMVDALYVLIAVLGLTFLYIVLDIAFGKELKMPSPPSADREVRFTARPYRKSLVELEAGEVDLVGNLTGEAQKEFEGDTMRWDVVRAAVMNGCALGLKIRDDRGRDVGFFDIYHLRPDPLLNWINGTLAESKLEPADYEPIETAASRGDKSIEFIVGAILMRHENPIYNFYFGPLLGAASKRYLAYELRRFQKVVLYASIFSKAGRRYSQIFAFQPHLPAEKRGSASGGHDVYRASFSPADRNDLLFANSRDRTYVLDVKYD